MCADPFYQNTQRKLKADSCVSKIPGTKAVTFEKGHKTAQRKKEMQNLCVTSRTEQCCGEHRRRLELFCREDEAFICVLCVPKHSNHSFVFLHEAVHVYKEKLKPALSSLQLKVKDLKDLKNKNEKELLAIKEHACSLEQYITVQFAKLHQFLHDREQKLIQQLKNEEAKILKEMEKNIEYIKSNVTDTCITVSDAILELKIEEVETEEVNTLKEMEENPDDTKSYAVVTQEVVSDNLDLRKQQETTGFLTIPETFDDVAVTFSEEEWKMLRKQDKELHREVMVQNYETLVSMEWPNSQNFGLLFNFLENRASCTCFGHQPVTSTP